MRLPRSSLQVPFFCTTIYYFRYTKVGKQGHKFINAVCVYISLIGSCIVSFMFDCSYLDSLIALS